MVGRVLYSQKIQEYSTTHLVEQTHLVDGMYLIQLISDGKIVACEKFIKQ